jgi:hypothetical protein
MPSTRGAFIRVRAAGFSRSSRRHSERSGPTIFPQPAPAGCRAAQSKNLSPAFEPATIRINEKVCRGRAQVLRHFARALIDAVLLRTLESFPHVTEELS